MTIARRLALSCIFPICLIACWFGLFVFKGSDVSYIADPRVVFLKAVSLQDDLLPNTLLSLRRLLFGVFFGTLIGVLAGVLLGRKSVPRLLFGPTLNVLTAVPIIVLIPFFFLVFGFGEVFRVSVVATVVFLLVYQAVFATVLGFPDEWLEIAAHREKSELEITREMLLPSAMPEIVHAIRLSLLFAWLAIALAEKAVAELPHGGLGYQILRARELGLYDQLFAAVIVLGFIAWILDLGLGWIERAVAHWRGQ